MSKFFIVATYTNVLRGHTKTHIAGLSTDPSNWQSNEMVKCTKNLKPRDLTEGWVILDVAKQKVVKNRLNESGFDQLYQYYVNNFGDYINDWLTKQIGNNATS
jgi:hypothetical protein